MPIIVEFYIIGSFPFLDDILVDHKPDNVTVINFELTETKQEELFNEFKDINNSSSIGIKFEVTYGIESPSSEAQVLVCKRYARSLFIIEDIILGRRKQFCIFFSGRSIKNSSANTNRFRSRY